MAGRQCSVHICPAFRAACVAWFRPCLEACRPGSYSSGRTSGCRSPRRRPRRPRTRSDRHHRQRQTLRQRPRKVPTNLQLSSFLHLFLFSFTCFLTCTVNHHIARALTVYLDSHLAHVSFVAAVNRAAGGRHQRNAHREPPHRFFLACDALIARPCLAALALAPWPRYALPLVPYLQVPPLHRTGIRRPSRI